MANKSYDSDFCGSLPIHNINVIQDYGYLIVVSSHAHEILQFSENLEELTGSKRSEILGKPLSTYFETAPITALESRFPDPATQKVPLSLVSGTNRLAGFLHRASEYLVLELEHTQEDLEDTFSKGIQEIKYAMAAIERATTIKEASETGIRELRRLIGFDGVMMYRFDRQWNGTVIAEEKADGMEAYLGHTFPASDVPKQARALYLKNPYRLIPDINFETIRLFPIVNPVLNGFIDLSDCNLRGVASVHLEYLRNMKVQASMSVRVIHGGKLWGLMACHHRTPKHLAAARCSLVELLSGAISAKISALIERTDIEEQHQLSKIYHALINNIYASGRVESGLFDKNGSSIASMFKASGVYGQINGHVFTSGDVPPEEIIDNLLLWLQSKKVMEVFSTDHLADLFEETAPYADIASGLLAIPFDPSNGVYILCFRPEVVRTINWGGNPQEAINFEPGTDKYHPRASFKIWQEQVRNTSTEWSNQELAMADELKNFIQGFLNTKKR